MGETKELSPEEQIEKLKQMLAERDEKIERLETQNFKLRFDELTNLEMRRSYYQRVNVGIEKLIEDQSTGIGEMLEADELTAADMEKIKNLPFTLAAADLAYLSKYNNDPDIQTATGGEHTGGDIILSETAKIIQDVDPQKREISPKLNLKARGYRVGGDEFALLIELPPEEAENIANEFKIKQNAIEVPGADLPPMMNIDTAHVSEGINAFVRVFEKADRAEMSAEEKAKKIQDLTTRIADRRAMVQKGRERIAMLVDILEADEQKFDKNFTWMKKGAFGLEKEFYADLIEKKKSAPAEFNNLVNEIVRQQLKEQKERAMQQEAKEYAAVIEIADAKFVQAA